MPEMEQAGPATSTTSVAAQITSDEGATASGDGSSAAPDMAIAPGGGAEVAETPPARPAVGAARPKLTEGERRAVAEWQVGRQDVTFFATVLLSEEGDEVTAVVGARRDERICPRFLRLRLPRAGWIAALFGDPADEVAVYDAAFVAEVVAEAAKGILSVPKGYTRTGLPDPAEARRPRARRTRTLPTPAAGGDGTAAKLARRRGAEADQDPRPPGVVRRSLFDLDEF